MHECAASWIGVFIERGKGKNVLEGKTYWFHKLGKKKLEMVAIDNI